MHIYELIESDSAQYRHKPLYDVDSLPEETQIKLISKKPSNLVYIKHPSEAVQLAAVKQSLMSVVYIKFPTEQVQLYVVSKNSDFIEYINNPTDAVKNLAIAENGANILNNNVKTKLSKKIIENNKTSIIKTILRFMNKKDFEYDMIAMISILGRHKINWPELTIIKRSLIADKILKIR
jgi:hypothetical protein